jgi:ABC-2 type transport system permease protein
MLGGIRFDILTFLIYLLSCVLAYLVNFFFNICFGFLAFVVKYLWGANMMKACVVGFLSGTIIPLAFLPKPLETAFLILPFASLNYTPVMIYMGKYTGLEMLWYMGLQLFWVFAFWALSKLLWKLSVKRLCVQGG